MHAIRHQPQQSARHSRAATLQHETRTQEGCDVLFLFMAKCYVIGMFLKRFWRGWGGERRWWGLGTVKKVRKDLQAWVEYKRKVQVEPWCAVNNHRWIWVFLFVFCELVVFTLRVCTSNLPWLFYSIYCHHRDFWWDCNGTLRTILQMCYGLKSKNVHCLKPHLFYEVPGPGGV